MKKLTVILALCFCAAHPSFCVDIPDFEEGWDAYERGNYHEAKRLFALHLIHYSQPDPRVPYLLGVMALLGEGHKNSQPDYNLALQMFLEAAKYEHRMAMYQIGFIYIQGKGVPQNYTVAIKWFRKAIKKKYAPAMTALGLSYYLGNGVIQSNIMAHMWYNLASAYGDKKAEKLRDSLTAQMTSDQIAEAQSRALEWMEKRESQQ